MWARFDRTILMEQAARRSQCARRLQETPRAGLEPAILGLESRRLAHQSTGEQMRAGMPYAQAIIFDFVSKLLASHTVAILAQGTRSAKAGSLREEWAKIHQL